MIRIGDLVTREKYDNDIVFKVLDIKGNNCYLKGVCVRLMADATMDDLNLYDGDIEADDAIEINFNDYKSLDRNEYFYLPGKILHIDGDKEYLDKCMKFYKKNKLMAYGIYMDEEEFKDNIYSYLDKYDPDILVITGHDAEFRRKRNRDNYKNSSNFIKAVKEARRYERSHEKLLIVSGACQSNYEELIKAGANFASSPKRINIHALDPAIVACSLAFSDKNDNIDLISILDRTKYGADGMGGIITKGTMYVGYPRE